MNKDERKAYDRARYLEKRERILSNNRKWRSANKEKMKALATAWRKRNPERWVELVRKGQRKNPAAAYQRNVRRRAASLRATPQWANKDAISRIYAEAKSRGLEVDHIVPLISKMVCGLHWEGNLRLVTKRENSSKGNRRWESGN